MAGAEVEDDFTGFKDFAQRFLETLTETCQKTGWQVHAYCLMSNHFHLVVEGLKVTFGAGRITDVTATSGAETVRAQLDTDEGARSLGEVSLVDRDSRVAKAGLLFHNMLFDENAACHVAWGQSFPFSVADGLAMSNEQRYEIGLNRSAVHTDVVIGGAGLSVTGTGPKGTSEIIRDDEWVLGIQQ